MIDQVQQKHDTWESASITVAALVDAEKRATPFEKKGIRRALFDAVQSRLHASFELMDAIEADLRRAA
jgi:transcriptional regulator NrdR family protein